MCEKPTYEELERRVLELDELRAERSSELAALAAREEKYRFIAEQTADFIYTVDIQREQFIYISPSVQRMFGYTPEECCSLKIQELQTEESYVLQREAMLKAIERGPGEPEVLELDAIHKDGHVFPIEINARILFDNRGKPVEILGVARDITERRQAEEERARLQLQLIHAQKVEAVGRLAGGVAHDFNNMLAVIIGRSEMALEKAACDPSLFSDIESILKAARHSADLTRQLLTFGRRQDYTPRVVHLNRVIEDIIGMLRHLVGSDIEVDWLPGRKLLPVKIDASQVNQILANLCVNSRDAITSGCGTGRIVIRTENVHIDPAGSDGHADKGPGDYVSISVNDTGCGMAPEIQRRIFDPFFTTKKLGKGTGLGLSTIYGIVKQHSGHIDVQSIPDKGTTFRIYLPEYRGTV